MSMTTNHNGENWPYHPYEGSKPELQGSYVPCATNPCTLHGGSEIYATSSEDAYTKAHQNDTWGFTIDKTVLTNENAIASNAASIIKQSSEPDTELDSDSMTNTSKSLISNNTTTITDSKTTVNTMQTNASSNNSINTDNENTNKTVKFDSSSQSGYTSEKAKDTAIKQGLYIDGSPLLHRLTDEEKNKYWVKRPLKRNANNGGINMQAFARDIFPGAVLANDDIAGIKTRSMNAFNNATDSEREAIKAYTDYSYKYINKLLRNGSLDYESPEFVNKINSHIKNINTFMHHNATAKVIDKDTVVFRQRFLRESDQLRGYEEQAFYKAVAKSMKDGSEPIIARPDYMSTTWDVPKYFKSSRCSYLIKIPAGTRGIDVSDEGMNSDEHEFLIDKGYKFKVVGIYELSKLKDTMHYFNKSETRWSQDGYPIIALELIPSKN